MYSLSEGALDKIMNGVDVDQPVLQILGHKKLASSTSGERYRLLVSDGKRSNSYTMLATQLNSMITENKLTEFSICQINRYAISMVNTSGKQKRVMVILNIEVKVPGEEVGRKLGNPSNAEPENDSKPTDAAQSSAPENKETPLQKHNSKQSSASDISTTPIVALSPYQNRWVIKARVISKSGIRTWSNSRGEGKLFSMDLVDESGEIRCTAFRNQCDKFFEMIEVGKVYYISRASLKTANKQFSNLNNDYEMTLGPDSEIIPCHDAGDDLPTIQFDFLPITQLENKQKNDIIDVLGIVKSCGNVQTIVSRTTNREMTKRDINLIDESNTMITLTLWGTEANEFDGSNNPVLAIKGARVGEFNGGKSLSTLSSSVLQIDPDIPEAHRLRGWYNTTGQHEDAKSLSRAFSGSGGPIGPLTTLQEAKKVEAIGHGAQIFSVKATVSMIRTENSMYHACPTEGCNKKLIDQDNGMYRCEKCDRDFPNFKYRLLVSMNLADWSGQQWVIAFNDQAEKLLGMSAQDIGELYANDNTAYLQKCGSMAFKTFIFKIRSSMEVYNDETRLKMTCMDVVPMDYQMYNEHLLTKLKELLNIEKA